MKATYRNAVDAGRKTDVLFKDLMLGTDLLSLGIITTKTRSVALLGGMLDELTH